MLPRSSDNPGERWSAGEVVQSVEHGIEDPRTSVQFRPFPLDRMLKGVHCRLNPDSKPCLSLTLVGPARVWPNLVGRQLWELEDAGSNPVARTKFPPIDTYGWWTGCNPVADGQGGSIPSRGTGTVVMV